MRLQNARGAITIHVAIALIALLAFTALTVDQGTMYVARRQAQNAADAGAIAGAITLMESATNYTLATQAAQHFAGQQNAVWGANTSNADIVVSPLPWPCPPSAGGGNSCIRVDVMRGTPDHDFVPHTNTMPTYFASLVGINSQGVRATATAQVAAGNAVNCIKPWIVSDKWADNDGTTHPPGGWDQNDLYNPPTDVYTPPAFKATGPNNDYGTQLALKQGNASSSAEWGAGWTFQIDFGVTGSNAYNDEIRGCPDYVPEVGLYDPTWPCAQKSDPTNPTKGCISVKSGMATGPTKDGVDYLISLDSSAVWDPSTNSISGGCTAAGNCTNPTGAHVSPRIVPVAIMNTQAYYAEKTANECQTQNCVAQVVNILGFFIEGFCTDVYPNQATRPAWCGTNAEAAKAVVGRLVAYPGQANTASGPVTNSSFIKTFRLVL